MKYTIKEISKAWFKFIQPTYLVDNKNIVSLKDLEHGGQVIKYDETVQKMEIDYSQWITYLISEEWK